MKLLEQSYEVLDVEGIATLVLHPQNPNRGESSALAESINSYGFYGAVIVQRSTNFVLAGNHRLEHARISEAEQLPVIFVDVDEDTAKRILLTDNRISRLGSDDPQALADLLADLSGQGLEGTGYDQGYLDALLKDLDSPEPIAPLEFARFGEDTPTEHQCPKCGFEWKGPAK